MTRLIFGLLFLSTIVLACSQPEPSVKETAKEEIKEESGPKIVFVNVDSLLSKYTKFVEQQRAFSKKEREADDRLKYRGRALEKEMQELYRKAQSGDFPPIELQKEEKRLTEKQQSLMADQERISKNLLEEGQKLNERLQAEIREILQRVKLENNYDFILSYGIGSSVLVAEESLDITNTVLKYLNEENADESDDTATQESK